MASLTLVGSQSLLKTVPMLQRNKVRVNWHAWTSTVRGETISFDSPSNLSAGGGEILTRQIKARVRLLWWLTKFGYLKELCLKASEAFIQKWWSMETTKSFHITSGRLWIYWTAENKCGKWPNMATYDQDGIMLLIWWSTTLSVQIQSGQIKILETLVF